MCHFRGFDTTRREALEETEREQKPAEEMDVPTMEEPEIADD
jgi:hypothetical protein